MLSVEEVASQLGVSESHVRTLIRDRRLKAANIGRGHVQPRYRVRQEWVDAFIESKLPRDLRPAKKVGRRNKKTWV